MTTRPQCPICHREVAAYPDNPSFPFCGPRCKLIDLGRWLDGTYRIPGPPAFAPDDGDDPQKLPS
jgi:endogenous inhibitor of DNA gyrase (YacG/DUF329 family)